jgi:hypothetical protein
MKQLHVLASAVLLPLTLILGGCGDSGGDDKLSDSEAKSAGISALAAAVNATAAAMESSIADSDATNVTADTGLLKLRVDSATKKRIVARYQQVLGVAKKRAATLRARSPSLHTDSGIVAASEVVDEEELDALLVLSNRDGDVLTYSLNADHWCEGEIGADLAACIDDAKKISVVQTLDGDTSGTFAILINGHTLLVIGYASDSVYVEVDFAEIKLVLESTGDWDPDSEVTAFQGKIRLAVAVANVTAGQEKATVTLSVPAAINVGGVDAESGKDVSVTIAATSKLIEVMGDAGTDTASISLGVGVIDAKYPDEESLGDLMGTVVYHDVEEHIGGLTGTITVTHDTLTATGLGVGDGIYSKTDGVKDSELTMDELDLTVTGVDDTVSFDKALNLYEMDEKGTLTETAPAGTKVKLYEVADVNGDYYTVSKVTAVGPYVMTGAGGRMGSLSVAVGQCFMEIDSPFPWQMTTCPAM